MSAIAEVGFYLERNLPEYDKDLDENSLFVEMITTPNQDKKKAIMEDIIKNNLRLVAYIIKNRFHDIKNFCQTYRVTYDDIFSAGYLGLVKAVSTFNPKKGIKFASYSTTCVYNELGMFIRKHIRSITTSLDDTVNEDFDGNTLTIGDLVFDRVDHIERLVDEGFRVQILDILDRRLKPRQIEVLKMILENEDATQDDIGRRLGISQSYISRLVKATVWKAQQIVKEYEKK